MLRKILITGGQGFLGGRIAFYLAESGNFDVTIVSRTPKQISEELPITSIEVNTKSSDLEALLEGYDAVIHLAALDSNSCVEKPFEANDVNINDTLRWRMAANEASVPKFIYFSTIHVYGVTSAEIITEDTCTKPFHPYAISHSCAEQYVISPIYSTKSLGIVFRLSNTFGYPKTEISQWHLVVLDFCKQAIETGEIVIKSNSSILRDFIPLSTVCKSVVFAINNKLSSNVYNLSSGFNKSLLEVAHDIEHIMQTHYKLSVLVIEMSEQTRVTSPIILSEKLESEGCKLGIDYLDELRSLIDYCFYNFFKK